MKLVLVALTMVLALASTALAQTQDLRAPDQVAPAATQAPATQDLRAPDQVAPAATQAPVTQDLRAPDQVAPAPTLAVPTPASDGGPAAIVFVLLGLGAALVLLAGGYLGARYRHRTALADADLVVQ
jgi:hypothetical protein